MKKVTELVQSAHMDKIHQQAKLVQMVKVIKQAKTVKVKKINKLAELTCLLLNYALFSCVALNNFFSLFATNHADFSFI